MATWAQIVGDQALNVISGDDLVSAFAQHFVPGYDGGHPGIGWSSVPDGTQSGAWTADGVAFTNPSAPSPIPTILLKTAFRAYAVTQLGGGTTGMARFQAIMDAAEAGSGAVKFCWSQYEDASTVVLSDLTVFLGIMLSASIITQTEHDNVLNNWPSQ